MGRRWSAERRRDPYHRAAMRQGLRSRAAFKLLELIERHRLIQPGDRVLDLGASPGGWSVIALQATGPQGIVVAVDVRAFEETDGVRFVHGRVGDPRLLERLGKEPFDVVLSDMSPSLSGAYSTDHARSVELVREGFALARRVLRPGGTFVAKVFQGDLIPSLREELSPAFGRLFATKPRASREASSEQYLIGVGFRGGMSGPGPERALPSTTPPEEEGRPDPSARMGVASARRP